MSKWFNIIVFIFMVNVSIGILNSIDVDTGALGAGDYEERASGLAGELDSEITTGTVESEPNWFEKIVDLINLNIFTKIKNFVYNYIFGAITLLQNMGVVAPGSGVSIALHSVLTLIYGLGIFSLFTGRLSKMTG